MISSFDIMIAHHNPPIFSGIYDSGQFFYLNASGSKNYYMLPVEHAEIVDRMQPNKTEEEIIERVRQRDAHLVASFSDKTFQTGPLWFFAQHYSNGAKGFIPLTELPANIIGEFGRMNLTSISRVKGCENLLVIVKIKDSVFLDAAKDYVKPFSFFEGKVR